MATAPVKSRPLHNFSLSHLQWAHCNPRVRRRNSPDPNNNQPPYAADINNQDEYANQISGSKASSELENKNVDVLEKGNDDVLDDGSEGTETMPWKLRPRKVVTLQMGSINKKAEKVLDERGSKNVVPPPNSTKPRGTVAEGGVQKRAVEGKKRLWISLSKEEIEEDVYAFTGSRPSRKPRKRARNVQRVVDNVYPGLYLVGLSADSFRIPDPCS